ncbi:MAG: AraC family transcriptional regulator [Oscillospiraceae bacterium]
MDGLYAGTSEALCFHICGNLRSAGGFLHERRVMDCCVLIFVLEGTLFVTQFGIAYAVSSGQYLFLSAGEEHFGHKSSDGRLSYLWVHFVPEKPWRRCDAPPAEFTYLIPAKGTAGNSPRVRALFEQLLDFSRQEALYTDAILSCALRLLLMAFTQECADSRSRKSPAPPVIAQVTAWMKANFHRDVSLNRIAAEFHYNPAYLSVLFKKETGITLVRYLNGVRIDAAKALLAGQFVSIKEAAYSCGFQDEKYFMRTFKQYTGMTPQQYKNSV